MKGTRITHLLSCGTMSLPPNLAYSYCKPSIIKANEKGIEPKRIKKCMQPWHHRWATHQEIEKVKVYFKIQNHLGNDKTEGDGLKDGYIYRKGTKDKQQKKTRQFQLIPSIFLLAENSDHDRSICIIQIAIIQQERPRWWGAEWQTLVGRKS